LCEIPLTLSEKKGNCDDLALSFWGSGNKNQISWGYFTCFWIRIPVIFLSDNDWLARLLLGFGPDAEILAPETLRTPVQQMAQEIANRYSEQ
jgi:predicted DNA-binding transcriptional regulator YafY